MSTRLLNELHSASFKGAPFLIVVADKDAGRKVVVYDYPGKNNADSQDLGKLSATITLNGVITGTPQISYFTAKKRLEDALESSGPGILLHPFYGPIRCVAYPYSVTDDTDRLNEAQYRLIFRKVGSQIFPSSLIADISKIIAYVKKMFEFMHLDFINKYLATSPLNKKDAGLKLRKLSKTMKDTIASVDIDQDDKNTINKNLDELHTNAFTIASDPSQMAQAIPDIMEQFGDLTDDSETSYNINSQLLEFGEDDTAINQTTTDLAERQQNREIMNNAINGLALSNMYVDASAISYTNNEQIDDKVIDLKNGYNFIIDDNILSNDTLDTLYNLNSATRKLLEELEVNIDKVTIVFVKTTNLASLVYSYYGSLDRYDEILDLNADLVDPTIISGNLKMLTKND